LNEFDPKLTVLQFNDYISKHDLQGLSSLLSEDHVFIDRKGKEDRGKETMMKGWKNFFQSFPHYRNTF
jgi:ketosteroid isomerase-like protein